MLKLWLLPKVWLHGSQSTTTGGSSATKHKPAAIIAWFEHSMRWVLMTPLGFPVDPEVNRNFAIVPGVTLALAAVTPASSSAPTRSENSVALRSAGGLRVTTSSSSLGITAAMARGNGPSSLADKRPGGSRGTRA